MNGLNDLFRGALVNLEARAFSRHGLNKRQRQLVDLIKEDIVGRSVIEIGCGIGAVTTTLLTHGAERGCYVELSEDYLRLARELASKAGIQKRATFHLLDFAREAASLGPADIVIADRVVCCYPDAEKLIRVAAEHSQRILIFTYPRPSFLTRLGHRLVNLTMRVLSKDYRFFLHDPERLNRAAEEAGLRLDRKRSSGLWRLALYERLMQDNEF